MDSHTPGRDASRIQGAPRAYRAATLAYAVMMDEHDTLTDPVAAADGPEPSLLLTVRGSTHVGQVRSNNEDFQVVDRLTAGDHAYGIWIVADGMGGGVRGEVASRMAATTALAYLRENEWTDPAEALRAAFTTANNSVFEEGTGGGMAGRSLMGTTLVVAVIDEETGDTWIGNVGDSRAYVADGAELIQVTEDHSLVGERVAAGLITKKEANEAPDRNIVTRAIGTDASVMVDVFGPRRLQPGETIILCSDGLHGMVDEELIHDFARTYTVDELPGVLIGAANDHGGRDNITVVAGGFRTPAAAPAGIPIAGPADVDTEVDTAPAVAPVEPVPMTPIEGARKRRIPRALMAIAAAVAALAVVGGGGAFLLNGDGDGTNAADDDGGEGAPPEPVETTEPTEGPTAPDGDGPGAAPSPTDGGSQVTEIPTRTPEPEATATAPPTESDTATPESTATPEPTATPLAPGDYVVTDGDTCNGIAERQLLESGLVADVTGQHILTVVDLIARDNRPGVCEAGNPIVGEVISLPSAVDLATAISQLPAPEATAPSTDATVTNTEEPGAASAGGTTEGGTATEAAMATETETPERGLATAVETQDAP